MQYNRWFWISGHCRCDTYLVEGDPRLLANSGVVARSVLFRPAFVRSGLPTAQMFVCWVPCDCCCRNALQSFHSLLIRWDAQTMLLFLCGRPMVTTTVRMMMMVVMMMAPLLVVWLLNVGAKTVTEWLAASNLPMMVPMTILLFLLFCKAGTASMRAVVPTRTTVSPVEPESVLPNGQQLLVHLQRSSWSGRPRRHSQSTAKQEKDDRGRLLLWLWEERQDPERPSNGSCAGVG